MNPLWNHPPPPSDPSLIEGIVNHMKSQGVFDQFRYDCLADVDTKPSYQNLSQRVDGYVTKFLSTEEWNPDMNKNELRNKLRRDIETSGMLSLGVDHIIEQLINAKIHHIFLPKIEEVVYQYLESMNQPKEEIRIKIIKTDAPATPTSECDSKTNAANSISKSTPVGSVKNEIKKSEHAISKHGAKSNLLPSFTKVSDGSKLKTANKDGHRAAEKKPTTTSKIGFDKIKKELGLDKETSSQDSVNSASSQQKSDRKTSSTSLSTLPKLKTSHSTEKHSSSLKGETKNSTNRDSKESSLSAKHKEIMKSLKVSKADLPEKSRDKKCEKQPDENYAKRDDKYVKDKSSSQSKSSSKTSNSSKPKTSDNDKSKPKLKTSSSIGDKSDKDSHQKSSSSSKEHPKSSSHSSKDTSAHKSKSLTFDKGKTNPTDGNDFNSSTATSGTNLQNRFESVLLLSRTPPSKQKPLSTSDPQKSYSTIDPDSKSMDNLSVPADKFCASEDDLTQDKPFYSSKTSNSNSVQSYKSRHSSVSSSTDSHDGKLSKNFKSDIKNKMAIVTDSDSSQSSLLGASDSASNEAEASQKTDNNKKKVSCKTEHEPHTLYKPPSPPPDDPECTAETSNSETTESKKNELESCGEKSDSDSESEISCDGVSSVHTSDLSSFDDNVSVSSNDEGSEQKTRKKISLKEVVAFLHKTEQSQSSFDKGIAEVLQQNRLNFSDLKFSEKFPPQKLQNSIKHENEQVLKSNGLSSEDLEDTTASEKRTKRQRKLNPKYASGEYTSIFNQKNFGHISEEDSDSVDELEPKQQEKEESSLNNSSDQADSEDSSDNEYSKTNSKSPDEERRKRNCKVISQSASSSNDVDDSDDSDRGLRKSKRNKTSESSESEYRITLKITKVPDKSPTKTSPPAKNSESPGKGKSKSVKTVEKSRANRNANASKNISSVNSRRRRTISAASDHSDHVNHRSDRSMQQRYDSSDLYKPRPIIQSSTRSRRLQTPPLP